MPVATLMVPSTLDSVSRTLVRGLAQEFNARLGIEGDIATVITPAVGHPVTAEGTQDKLAELARLPTLDTDRRLTLEVEETFPEEGILQDAVYREEYPYVFRDERVGLTIRPTYARSRLVINFKYQFRHQTEADQLVKRLRLHGGLHSIPTDHRLHYQYGLPDSLQAFIYDVHQMREAKGQYGQTLSEYMQECFIEGGLGSRRTQDGEVSALAINEVQHNITGFFNEELYYQPATQEISGHIVTFALTVDYQHIQAVVVQYPTIVHNERIPQVYIDYWKAPRFASVDPSAVLSYIPPNNGEATEYYYAGDGGHRLDPVDDWFPKMVPKDTVTQVISPLQVYEPDPTLVLNLDDFPPSMLPDHIKDVLKVFPDRVNEPYALPYLIQIYRVCGRETLVEFSLLPDGTIRTLVPMDPTCRYYIRISVVIDLSRLPVDFAHWMLKHPDLTLKVCQHVWPEVTVDADERWLESARGQWITHKSYDRTIKNMPTTNDRLRMMDSRLPRLTQRSAVLVYEQDR